MNEITIFISTEAMLFYTNVFNITGQDYTGWTVVTMFLINMSINLIIVFYKTFRLTMLKWRKRYRMHQLAKTMKATGIEKLKEFDEVDPD